ncbi:chaplin [Streptomyces sp. NPDC006971]|uniref:chaplin n=1 Tax=Streptomyces sp. NPDC006971 TaxID=3154784 RepID=UPI00340CFAC0
MKYTKAAAIAAGTLMAMGAAAPAFADAGTSGRTAFSPGVLSGDAIQAPIHTPAHVCGDTVNGVGILNPAFHNICING